MCKKIVLCIFILISTNQLFAQNYLIKGILYDEISKEPIPFVAVGVNDFSTGTITNIDGEYNLHVDHKIDSLVVSHLNYGRQTFALKQNINDPHIVYLKAKEILIDEVIVTAIPVSQILLNAVKRSQEKLTKPILLNTYYREFVKTNDKYTKFSDGLLNYYLSGSKKLKSELFVEDSRAVELFDVTEESFEYDMTSVLDVSACADVSYVSRIGEFLIKKNVKKYNYTLRTRKDDNGDEYMIIIITPKKNVKERLMEGKVIIDSKTGLILEVEYEMPDSHKQYSKVANILVLKAKLHSKKVRVLFQQRDNNYYILYVLKDATIGIWNEKKFKCTYRFTSDLIITNTQKENIKLDKKLTYNKQSLYNRGIPTKEEFWLTNNSIKLTEEQQKIIESLNGETK